MFTDGLDPSALQWVREGLDYKERAVPSPFVDTRGVPAPRLAKENVLVGRKKGKNAWDLPPTHLPSAHFHSGLIRSTQFASAVLDESSDSVGSASGDNHEYEDFTDSESGRYSLHSSSPPENSSSTHAYVLEKVDRMDSSTRVDAKAAWGGTDEYYYEYDRRLLSSRSNSKSNSRCNSQRESFGRLDGRQAQAWQKSKDPSAIHGSGCGEPEDQKYCNNRGTCSDGESWEAESRNNRASGCGEEANSGTFFNGATSSTGYVPTIKGGPEAYGHEFDKVSCINGAPSGGTLRAPPSAPPMMGPSRVDVDKAESKFSSSCTNVGKESSSCELEEENKNVRAEKPWANVPSDSKQGVRSQTLGSDTRVQEGAKQSGLGGSHALVYSSGSAVWPAIIAYDACVRLCLRAWSRGCVEAPEFLADECSQLRSSFGLEHILLRPHESIVHKPTAEDPEAIASCKHNKDGGKIRIQVRKVKLAMRVSRRCNFPSFEAVRARLDLKGDLLPEWDSVKKFCMFPQRIPRSISSRGAGSYMQAGAHYMRQVSGLLKAGVSTLRSTTLMDTPEEMYTCLVRLKSTPEDEVVRMHPGSGDSHVFHPESSGDDLILEVHDSKQNFQGKALVQLASISDDQNDKVRWWSLHHERDQECVGKVQLFISYTVDSSSSVFNKVGIVSETLAYDTVLEAAMRRQQFRSRNLGLQGSWKWLLSEFAVYYGVSDAYTKLRYLSCIMEVATPTEDCLLLIYDLLYPLLSCQPQITTLSRQEKRMLSDVQDQIEQLLALTFENYKSLSEASPSGIIDGPLQLAGTAAPALGPAVQIYTLLHDILALEVQSTLRGYFQRAALKRCRRYMTETDEFVASNSEGFLIDPFTMGGAYSKMKNLCANLSNEVLADIEIHNQHILPSSIDLPNIATGIYSVELCNRLRAFLVSCPPSSPSQPVIDLLLGTADFERDLVAWNIRPLRGGVDAKDLFHLYIVLWIQDKRLNLLDFCKLDKVRWTGVTTQHGTSPFVEEMYERIWETLNEYDVLLTRWPEYTVALESAIADVETAIVAALEKQFTDVLVPLKDVMVPKKFSLQYVQKLTRRRTVLVYSVPNQLGIFLNTIKRLLDTLRPKVEVQMRSWVQCLASDGNEKAGFGERLNEVTVTLRTKYKNFLQAVVEKLVDNAGIQRTTKLKKILQDTQEAGGESEIRDRMQLLNSQLMDTISHLHDVFSARVFVAICRGYWDRMGQDVLQFLETRKENRSWYKGSWYALTILDDLFASQMQKLQGHALHEKDLEPPRSVMEARSMLSKDAQLGLNDSSYLYF